MVVMSLATAMPAAAAPEALSCSGTVTVFGRAFPFSTIVTVDSSQLVGLSAGQVVKLSNGLTATIASASTVDGTLTISGTATLSNGIKLAIKCTGPAPTV
jgi:phage baseplate assembly protein gpV